MLKKGDLTVGEISDAFDMTTPSISYHLDLLKNAQLVSARKKGQFVTYSLETTVLDESLGWILDLLKKPKETPNETQTNLARSGVARRAAVRSPGIVG